MQRPYPLRPIRARYSDIGEISAIIGESVKYIIAFVSVDSKWFREIEGELNSG
jgi:hypothetical protein